MLHYKFHAGLAAKIGEAVAREQYFDGSAEYKHYARVLGAAPGLGLAYPGSRRYRGPGDLVAAGLIEPIAWEDTAGAPRRG